MPAAKHVGIPLFIRKPRQVILTAVGRRLSPKVTEALDLLGAAFAEVTEKSHLDFAISVLPTVASAWLVPRLASCQMANPNIKISLHTSSDVVDFDKDEIDLVVRGGDGN